MIIVGKVFIICISNFSVFGISVGKGDVIFVKVDNLI